MLPIWYPPSNEAICEADAKEDEFESIERGVTPSEMAGVELFATGTTWCVGDGRVDIGERDRELLGKPGVVGSD